MHEPSSAILIAGASGGIGRALCEAVHERWPQVPLLSMSRHSLVPISSRHRHLQINLAESSAIAGAREFLAQQPLPDWVINCCGVLHSERNGPEKSLQQCSDDWLQKSMTANVLPHMHLAQALAPLLHRMAPLVWASLSAKVGSIADNRLGGWYSYRMSKAALNMLIKNIAIEWGRKLDSCCVVAVHPGTTDTALSEPFQANIQPGKLYSASLTAERIVQVLRGLDSECSGKLLFWDGSELPC